MSGGTRWTPQQRQAMYDALQAGETHEAVADRFGATVRGVAIAASCVGRERAYHPSASPELRAMVVELLATQSVAEVHLRTGIAKSTLYDWLEQARIDNHIAQYGRGAGLREGREGGPAHPARPLYREPTQAPVGGRTGGISQGEYRARIAESLAARGVRRSDAAAAVAGREDARQRRIAGSIGA